MHIIPALLTNTAEDLYQQVDKLLPYYSHFQIDIADGQFVPNTTVQISELISYLSHTEKSYDTSIQFDFHLMVNNWENEIDNITQIGDHLTTDVVFIHYGVLMNYSDLHKYQSKYTMGIVLNPEDKITDIHTQVNPNKTQAIQIMSVNPGFQGSPFLPETLQKIEYLKKNNYSGKIYIDGAVNDKTLPVINQPKWRPDYVGIGSFLSKADNIEDRVAFLKQYQT